MLQGEAVAEGADVHGEMVRWWVVRWSVVSSE